MSSIRRTYYRGYLIRPKGDDFDVVTPCGELWTAIAVNRKTAKRWVDCDIADLLAVAERRAKRYRANLQPVALTTSLS